MSTHHAELIAKAKKVKLLILDCDGVLTDGKIYFTHHGEEMIGFNVLDGYGIVLLRQTHIHIAVISGRDTPAVFHRLTQLKIPHIFLGQLEKTTAFESLLKQLQITPDEVAYMGDDLPDIEVMQKVGLPVAVQNAMPAVKKIATLCTEKKGGEGAVREVCDLLFAAHRA